MSPKYFALVLAVGGLLNSWFPGFAGLFKEPYPISTAEAAILSSIFFVGAVVCYAMPTKS